MNRQLENTTNPCQPSGDADRKKSPKLVIGLIRGELARGLETHCRALGWRVCSADTCQEVRAKAHGGRASVVVLPVSAFDTESAFLTCAKLVRGLPKAKVILIGPDTAEYQRFARFVGAAGYVPDTTSATDLVRLVVGGKPVRPH